ncbi:uncharacterized protein [Argopecten irradians]|uniref:uncharacterized protein n=1 Tax=Argopecten irradians TaxID=31199 RepID=UPI0037245A32
MYLQLGDGAGTLNQAGDLSLQTTHLLETPTPMSPSQTSPTPMSPSQMSPTPMSPSQTSPTPMSPSQTSPTPMSPTQMSPTPMNPLQTSPTPMSPLQQNDPYTNEPFTNEPYTNEPYTNEPYTGSPYASNESGEQEDGNLAQMLHKLRRMLEQRASNDLHVQPSQTVPAIDDGDDDGDDDYDDDENIRNLMECWFNDIVGNSFLGFPNGRIWANLTIDGARVQYILTRAVRQYQLSDGDVEDVLKSMVRGLIKTIIVPHKSCPATKFHQVVIWSLRSLLKYHLSNDTGSLKEQFKAILTSSNIDPNNTVAPYMVSEIQHHIIGRFIRIFKFQIFADFFDPLEYIAEEMASMFGKPRNSSSVAALLRDVAVKYPWYDMCITPRRLIEMNLNMINEINEFVKDEELGAFLGRAEVTMKEEFLLTTGSEQIQVVQKLIFALESHIRSYVNGTTQYAKILLSGDTNQLINLLSNILEKSQLAYFQNILSKLGPMNVSASPAPVTSPSHPNVTSSPTATVQRRRRLHGNLG